MLKELNRESEPGRRRQSHGATVKWKGREEPVGRIRLGLVK